MNPPPSINNTNNNNIKISLTDKFDKVNSLYDYTTNCIAHDIPKKYTEMLHNDFIKKIEAVRNNKRYQPEINNNTFLLVNAPTDEFNLKRFIKCRKEDVFNMSIRNHLIFFMEYYQKEVAVIRELEKEYDGVRNGLILQHFPEINEEQEESSSTEGEIMEKIEELEIRDPEEINGTESIVEESSLIEEKMETTGSSESEQKEIQEENEENSSQIAQDNEKVTMENFYKRKLYKGNLKNLRSIKLDARGIKEFEFLKNNKELNTIGAIIKRKRKNLQLIGDIREGLYGVINEGQNLGDFLTKTMKMFKEV
ncbi:hypothetical protein NUSPORA_01569 [Nucleospora cyclopteri]